VLAFKIKLSFFVYLSCRLSTTGISRHRGLSAGCCGLSQDWLSSTFFLCFLRQVVQRAKLSTINVSVNQTLVPNLITAVIDHQDEMAANCESRTHVHIYFIS